ncbi:MAG: hypothetical protein ACRCYO_15215 [Bacteroidia bacterium]
MYREIHTTGIDRRKKEMYRTGEDPLLNQEKKQFVLTHQLKVTSSILQSICLGR